MPETLERADLELLDTDEYDREWDAAAAAAPPVKDPGTRFMDMLGAWAQKAAADPFPDSDEVLTQICGLYQEAGQFAFKEMESEAKKAQIQAFLIERVLPTLTM